MTLLFQIGKIVGTVEGKKYDGSVFSFAECCQIKIDALEKTVVMIRENDRLVCKLKKAFKIKNHSKRVLATETLIHCVDSNLLT